MSSIWETLTPAEIRGRTQTSIVETVTSGFATIVSGAVTGVVRYIMKVMAHNESDSQFPILSVTRINASGTGQLLKTHRFSAGLSGVGTQQPWVWENVEKLEPVADLHAEEYLQVRSSVSGMVSVSVDFFNYGGAKDGSGRVQGLRAGGAAS